MKALSVRSDGRSRAIVRRETLTSYIFLAPCLILFLGFVVFPMGMCLVTSFFNYNMTDFAFTGLDNYIKMFGDPIFLRGVWNTMIIVLVSVPVVTMFSLWVASVVHNMKDVACSFYRCVFYLPVVTGTVAVTVVWKWIFNNYTGVLNFVCKSLGLISRNVNWLGNESTALACIITILLTTSIGQPIVLYISALNNVDKSLTEAAQVDGATNFQTFWRIMWPSIMPTTLYIIVITTINSFQCFALIQLLTSGGPQHSTETIMYYIYYQSLTTGLNNYGYANAMGVVLALIIAFFSALQFRITKQDK